MISNQSFPAPQRRVLLLALWMVGSLWASAAVAQPADRLGLIAGRPTVRPVRVAIPPDIDGRLDDPVWGTAATLTAFTQQAPLEGAPATEDTEVYIAYDSENIYFGFYLHYADPSIMRANRVDRDTAFQDDLITIYLDTFLAQQRAYDFDLNAFNVQGDGIVNATGNRRGGPIPAADRSWDALFSSATEIVEDGYTAEMAIPLKSLRYPQRAAGEPHQWGLQIVREIKGKNQENVVWAPMSRDVAGVHRQMGLMEGMTDFSTSRNLEFLPTFTAIKFGSLDTSTGGFVTQDTDPQAGLNIKYGLTSNLTFDVTFNPDFSQIESDRPQIEVNQRFPLFFNELRPFFVEGAEIFAFPGPVTFVHTRTIVDPTWGAKLTGKAGRFSVGVLTAEDEAQESAHRSRNGDLRVFDVQIYRAQSILTFTDRLLMRNITEYNTFDKDLDFNALLTYRVNAGTVFFVGYDDHYRQEDRIEGDVDGDGFDERLFFTSDLRRTNRAGFTKLRYLFRI